MIKDLRVPLCALLMPLLAACVTRVDTGQGLTGGPITSTGTVALDTGFTDGRYARLNANNTFNGDQVVNGTVGITAQTGLAGLTNSLRVTDRTSDDGVVVQSGVVLGQALGVHCTVKENDCWGLWVTGSTAGGVFQSDSVALSATGPIAGSFFGDVNINGTLTKSAGFFKIDHPLDPANKYLVHSFVESPDMMNIYNGVAALDGKGQAWVSLPDWFEAVNGDFRYQLTSLGKPAPNLHVAAEVANNRFRIAGGQPKGRVSWQVTGIRRDAYAQAHRITVEQTKNAADRGYYLHPELFRQAADKGIFARQMQRQKPKEAK